MRTIAVAPSGLYDGIRVDTRGNVWASAGDGVYCYTPDGTLLGRINVPEVVANLVFGGPKRNRMYICGTTSLYAVYLKRAWRAATGLMSAVEAISARKAAASASSRARASAPQTADEPAMRPYRSIPIKASPIGAFRPQSVSKQRSIRSTRTSTANQPLMSKGRRSNWSRGAALVEACRAGAEGRDARGRCLGNATQRPSFDRSITSPA